MSREQFYLDPITQVYTTADLTAPLLATMLGRQRITWPEENYGDADAYVGEVEWIFVTNNEGVAWTEGEVISRDVTTATNNTAFYGTSATASSAGASVLGVVDHAIDSGESGWIKRKGMCEISMDASAIVAGTVLMTSATAGQAALLAGGNYHQIIGVAVDANGSAPGILTAVLALA